MNTKNFTILLLFFCSISIAQDLNLQIEANYDFENDLSDQTGNDNNLTVLQGTANYISYNGGTALSLDGNTQIITTNLFDLSHSDSFAISIIFKTSTITNDFQIVLQGANIGFGVFIEPLTGKLYTFLDRSSSDPILSLNPVTDDEWHHAIVESNGTETSLYLDGVFQGSRAEILDVGNGGSDNKMFIGASNLNTRAFTGELDKVRIFSRDLTPCDRIDLTLNNFEPEGIFHFDENLEDASMRVADFEVTDGQITYENFAPGDEAIVFDGNTRIASINPYDNSDFQNATISFWLKAEQAKNQRQIIIQGANMGTVIFIEEDTGVLRISFDGSTSGSISSLLPITDGEWHHVSAMSIGTGTTLVLDGNFEGFATEDIFTGTGGNDNKWFIGQSSLNTLPFTGAINNLTIYDHVLETCQIERIAGMGPVSGTNDFIQVEPTFSISPNPSYINFVINFGENPLPEIIQVYDLNGKIIFSDDEIHSSKYELSIQEPSGIYILKTISEKDYSTTKLVKN